MMRRVIDICTGDNPLEHVCNVPLSRFFGKFSASSVFREGNIIGGMKVRKVGDEFMRLYLPIPFGKPSKNIPDIPPIAWPRWKLKRAVYDTDIFLVWLGKEERTSGLVRVFQTMSLGRKGPSLMNGLANVAFIAPVFRREPLTVYWTVYMDEWHIHAIPEPVNDMREVRSRCRLPQGVHIFGGLPKYSSDEKS